jgi:hypothetical protein
MESEKQLELTLLFEFTTHRLSELQLNLRKDGFGLDSVEIEGESFDVQAELEKAAMQGDKSKVDKQLIQFLNQYPQSAERSLVWSTQLWRATLLSDGELITLTLLGTLEQKDVR